jgi:hypothetical protein
MPSCRVLALVLGWLAAAGCGAGGLDAKTADVATEESSAADWTHWMEFKAWTPLRDAKLQANLIAEGLYRIGPHAYAVVVEYNESLEPKDPRAPFIALLMWAPSDGAAKRAALGVAELDDGVVGNPPPEIALGEANATYERMLRAKGPGAISPPVREATYRGKPDRNFVHRVINFGRLEFYFRGRDPDPNERAYAVKVKLK